MAPAPKRSGKRGHGSGGTRIQQRAWKRDAADRRARERQALLECAVKRYGEDDPVVRSILQLHLDVVAGINVKRHIDARLRAADRMLDRLVGRPRERSPEGGDFSDVDRVLAHLVGPDPGPEDE